MLYCKMMNWFRMKLSESIDWNRTVKHIGWTKRAQWDFFGIFWPESRRCLEESSDFTILWWISSSPTQGKIDFNSFSIHLKERNDFTKHPKLSSLILRKNMPKRSSWYQCWVHWYLFDYGWLEWMNYDYSITLSFDIETHIIASLL